MSNETAHKAAAYIAAHCGGEKVHLHWFGGEPLFNKQVIDIICTDLTEKGIVYESMMISNGYLFDGSYRRTSGFPLEVEERTDHADGHGGNL